MRGAISVFIPAFARFALRHGREQQISKPLSHLDSKSNSASASFDWLMLTTFHNSDPTYTMSDSSCIDPRLLMQDGATNQNAEKRFCRPDGSGNVPGSLLGKATMPGE